MRDTTIKINQSPAKKALATRMNFRIPPPARRHLGCSQSSTRWGATESSAGTMAQRHCCCSDDEGPDGGKFHDISRHDVSVGVAVFCWLCRCAGPDNGWLGSKRERLRPISGRLV